VKVGDLVRFRISRAQRNSFKKCGHLGVVLSMSPNRFQPLVHVYWGDIKNDASHYENDLEVISESR
jgi:hypothetical protein